MTDKRISIQQPEFFPWLGYFHKFAQVDEVVLLDNVQYKPRYFENRNKIRNAKDSLWIKVPVLTKGLNRPLIQDVKIADDQGDWRRVIINSLTSCYAKSPFWNDYGAPIIDMIQSFTSKHLADFNISVIEMMAAFLGLNRPMVRASTLGIAGVGGDLLISICEARGATHYLSGAFGRDYLDPTAFDRAGLGLSFQAFEPAHYPQFHPEPFISHLSSFDALMSIGPQAGTLIVGD